MRVIDRLLLLLVNDTIIICMTEDSNGESGQDKLVFARDPCKTCLPVLDGNLGLAFDSVAAEEKVLISSVCLFKRNHITY